MSCIRLLDSGSTLILKNLLDIQEVPNETVELLFGRTQKYMKYIAWIPGLQMVAVCNSLSMYSVDADSDIDLFVVTSPRRLWTVRILMTLVFQLLGVRRYGKKIAGRLCLSFFSTTDGLDMSEIALDGGDPYLATWVKYLSPILDKNGTYGVFVEKNKHWVIGMEENSERNRRYLLGGGEFAGHNSKGGAGEGIVPNIQDNEYSEKKDYSGNQHYFDRKTTWLGDRIEWIFKSLFLPYTERSYRKAGSPWGVIISEKYLKFHPNDRRREVRDEVFREGK